MLSSKGKSEQFLDNTKGNTEKYTDSKATSQYSSNTYKLLPYTKLTESIRNQFFDYLKLPTDDISVFWPRWIEFIKANVDSYLTFQDKMIMLYLQICNNYFKNIFDMIPSAERD